MNDALCARYRPAQSDAANRCFNCGAAGQHRPIDQKRAESRSSSTLNQVNNEDDDSNYEQQMDQTAANVAEQAKQPKHEQDDNYSPEHG